MNLAAIATVFGARRPGHSLPRGLYLDAEMLAFDMTAIFGESWLLAGFEAEVRARGDYLSMMVGQWPILIVRGREGELRAFHNSCRHRGSVVCPPGKGSAARLTCPYHRWTYDLNGRLLAAGRMPETAC